jgi:hypothetical protein
LPVLLFLFLLSSFLTIVSFQTVIAQCTATNPRDPTQTKSAREFALLIIRAASSSSGADLRHGPNAFSHPFDDVASFKFYLLHRLKLYHRAPLHQRRDPSWLSPFLHQLLIFLAILKVKQDRQAEEQSSERLQSNPA